MRPALDTLPDRPGAYRWYYFDVSAGELTAVAIFMLGSPFSARYAAQAGSALATRFASVNLAVYRGGKRVAWVFSEFDGATADPSSLRIGGSTLRWTGDRCDVRVDERSVLFGQRVEAELSFEAPALPAAPFSVVPSGEHLWQPVAPRAAAQLRFQGAEYTGLAYHDTNCGSVPLKGSLAGWRWSRTHAPEETVIRYAVDGWMLRVRTDGARIASDWQTAPDAPSIRTRWGLEVPAHPTVSAPRLLESSPFYARYSGAEEGGETLGEVARFAALERRVNRWMARSRLRVEVAR